MKTKTLMLLILASVLFYGCATYEMQTKTKLTRTVLIDHSEKTTKNLYLQVSNTAGSGGEDMILYEPIKNNLEAKGYKIVDNSKDADYGLFVNILFANSLKEANAIVAAANAGIATGTVAGISGAGAKDSLLIGAVFALGGATIGYAMEDDVFRSVVDITIRDYKEKPLFTQRTSNVTDPNVKNIKRAGNFNQMAGPIGDKNGAADMSSGISESVIVQSEKNYEEFHTRALAEATKMDLKLADALPVLEKNLSRQISNLF